MNIICAFILSTLYSVSFAQSDAQTCIICHYGGALATKLQNVSFTFSINDVPERCDVVGYGGTFINKQPDPEDIKAIQQLKSAGKTVFMLYMSDTNTAWADVIACSDTTVLDNYIAPMLTFLTENNIDGVILAYLRLLNGEIPDYTTKIYGFLSKIKDCAPNLKIGILVYSAYEPSVYGNKELFDFTVINCLVDIYFFDTALINSCDETTTGANGGRLPLTSSGTDDARFTLEQVSTNVESSGMDVNKIYIVLNDLVTKVIPNDNDLLSYSEYCASPVSETDIWCTDTMQQLYDNAVYAKSHFKGMIINGLDTDDYDNSCCCGLFPVANTYIDAWCGEPLKCCDKIA